MIKKINEKFPIKPLVIKKDVDGVVDQLVKIYANQFKELAPTQKERDIFKAQEKLLKDKLKVIFYDFSLTHLKDSFDLKRLSLMTISLLVEYLNVAFKE